jgi:hypothetical protein
MVSDDKIITYMGIPQFEGFIGSDNFLVHAMSFWASTRHASREDLEKEVRVVRGHEMRPSKKTGKSCFAISKIFHSSANHIDSTNICAGLEFEIDNPYPQIVLACRGSDQDRAGRAGVVTSLLASSP